LTPRRVWFCEEEGGNGSSTLPWSVRYKVVIGIAEARSYGLSA